LEDGATWSSSSEYIANVGDDVDLVNVMEWRGKVPSSRIDDLLDSLPKCPFALEVRFGDCDWDKWDVEEEVV